MCASCGMIVEHTQTGKAAASQDPNIHDGRPKKFTPEQGKTYRQVTAPSGIGKSTLIRVRQEDESMYAFRFVRKDGKPNEEYSYQKRNDAEYHISLFLQDNSDLYLRIELIRE